jgi:PmbA protein
MPILITGDAVPEFFGYYFNRLSSPQIHMGASDARLGRLVYPFASDRGTGESLSDSRAGDLPTLGFDPALPGGTENRPADADGFALERTALVEKGIIRAFEGPSRYAAWLDVPPKGACSSRWVAPGTLGDAGLKALDHLEACVFSDFYMDQASGDFGGELRLGILHKGNTKTPLTGGSISGSISEEYGMLRFTEAQEQHGSFLGPSGVLLGKARIAAVEG